MNKEVEEWRDIPEYEGYYQVSDMGRVRSLDRWVTYSNGRKRFYKGGIIEGSLINGYRRTTLRIAGRGRYYTFSQLVAMAFLGHEPDGHTLVVDHINGDRSNDKVDNLRIVTNRENCTTCFKSNKDSFSSRYSGVRRRGDNRRWNARITFKGDEVNLGTYDSEKDASFAYESAVTLIKDGKFNPDYYKPDWTSKYNGVNFHKRIEKWHCRATIGGKRKHLGYYNSEIEAHNAYQKAVNEQRQSQP